MLTLAGLVDAGFSGDWQARGVLSEVAADSARMACYTAAAAHVVLTAASAFIAKAKGAGVGSAAITLAVRPDLPVPIFVQNGITFGLATGA